MATNPAPARPGAKNGSGNNGSGGENGGGMIGGKGGGGNRDGSDGKNGGDEIGGGKKLRKRRRRCVKQRGALRLFGCALRRKIVCTL